MLAPWRREYRILEIPGTAINPPPLPPGRDPNGSRLIITLGIVFITVWPTIATLLGGANLMASLMANASGAAHLAFIGGMVAGQLLSGLDGVPAGMAFFRKRKRKFLLMSFLVLLPTNFMREWPQKAQKAQIDGNYNPLILWNLCFLWQKFHRLKFVPSLSAQPRCVLLTGIGLQALSLFLFFR